MIIPQLERERLTGISDKQQQRIDDDGEQRTPRNTQPQFESKPLLPTNINNYFAQFRQPEDRSELRAKIAVRNVVLGSAGISQPLISRSSARFTKLSKPIAIFRY